MPPPQLPRDAPGLDVLQPVVVRLLLALRQDPRLPRPNRRQRRRREPLRVHIPLVGQERFDRHLRPVPVRHHVRLRIYAVEPALLLRQRHHQIPRLVAPEPVELLHPVVRVRPLPERGVVLQPNPRPRIHDVDRGKPAALPDLPVVEVVRRSDLHRPRPLLGIRRMRPPRWGSTAPPRAAAPSCPTRCAYRASSGCTATPVSPSMVSGRVVATTR